MELDSRINPKLVSNVLDQIGKPATQFHLLVEVEHRARGVIVLLLVAFIDENVEPMGFFPRMRWSVIHVYESSEEMCG